MIKIEITDPHVMDARTLKETGLYLIALAGCELDDTVNWDICESGRKDEPAEYSPPEEPEAPEPVEPPNAAEVFSKIVPPVPERFEVLGTAAAGVKLLHGVELDAEGLPWDSRIHARTKTKTTDGCWKRQRGISASSAKKIEDELRGVQAIPAPAPLQAIPTPKPPVIPAPAPLLQAAPTPPPFLTQEKAPDFADLMTIVTAAITAGRLTRDQVVAVLEPYGIPSLPVISARPDLIPAVVIKLREVINAPC